MGVIAPPVSPLTEDSRLDFDGWQDGAARERSFTFSRDAQRITALYRTMFRVRAASDPDGGPLDVRFEGRRADATQAGEPFTIVAVPDTQNYTYNGRTALLNQHIQWVADSRTQLNTAFVAQLGDLVDVYLDAGPSQEQAASTIVDLTGPTPRVLREGPISAAAIAEVLGVDVATLTA